MKLMTKIRIKKTVMNSGLVLNPKVRVIVFRLGLIVKTSNKAKLRKSLLIVTPRTIDTIMRDKFKR